MFPSLDGSLPFPLPQHKKIFYQSSAEDTTLLQFRGTKRAKISLTLKNTSMIYLSGPT